MFVVLQEAVSGDSELLPEMMTAAQGVRDALNSLLIKVREGGRDNQQAGQYDEACDDILGATDRLFNSMGNAGEMVKQAKILAQVCLRSSKRKKKKKLSNEECFFYISMFIPTCGYLHFCGISAFS